MNKYLISKGFSIDISSIKKELHNIWMEIAVNIFDKGHISEIYTENPKILEKVRKKIKVVKWNV